MNGSFALVTGLHWSAVIIYAAATVCIACGAFFARERWERYGNRLAIPGIILHGAGLLVWWKIAGHGPYVGRFESLSSYAWGLPVGFLVFARLYPRIRAAGFLVYPATFIMVAIGLFLKPEIKQLPPTFRGIWLLLHILFYNISFCALVIALILSILVLLKKRNRLAHFASLPELPVLDLNAYRFVGFGFTFWAIGIISGSIWAYQSWNIFWSWDPVQTWSLIAWGMFGLYLHLRRFFAWEGERAAWLYCVCFLVVLVALFITPLIESSIHAEYFK